jgi:hypothetical protein
VDKRSRRTALLTVILAGQLVACGGGAPGEVPARANIFGAGRDAPPAPSGGGAGVLPPVWQLSAGTERLIIFSRVEGQVNPIEGEAELVGPAGDGGRFGTTDVKSYEGISGIVNHKNGMFLVGVFLTDAAPSGTAPARLDFTDREEFDLLEPEIGQTFLIGDGVGHRYRAPERATRLFLGFADSFRYRGDPGWYDNNVGSLRVVVDGANH